MNMRGFISQHKLFTGLLILNLLVTSYIVILSPRQIDTPDYDIITVPLIGEVNFEDYPGLDRETIGLINSLRSFYDVNNFSNASINNIDILPGMLTQYFFAFTQYGLAQVADTTPGFRSDYYKNTFKKLIYMMNSSAMEYHEWTNTSYSDPLYEEPGNDFRGPTNIMWTGHFALMELLYQYLFADDVFNDEIVWFLDDWKASLTADTTWDGKPANGLGLWGNGLIPCEPYIIFIQCNTIPWYTMMLYDELEGTDYTRLITPGMDWWQENMINEDNIPIDGYFFIPPWAELEDEEHRKDLPSEYPNPAMTMGIDKPKVSAYGSAWIIAFLKGMGFDDLASSLYSSYKEKFIHYSINDQAYVPDTYYYPDEFGIFEIVGNLFGYFMTKEMGDLDLNRKLRNFFYSPYQGFWSDDGFEYQFDTSAFGELADFIAPIVNFGQAWGRADSTLADILKGRSTDFDTLPFISDQSSSHGLFIYQAVYDEENEIFILNVEVNEKTSLYFDNYPHLSAIYDKDGLFDNWNLVNGQVILELDIGSYQLVLR
ncbi:MAG: hypothetical protein INQ03_17165 [Candidatus Heimdallarchaeota archaeon]|nr:hypothetical protein [Candidatus Heimdallarchaeota archaeon]